MKKTIAVLALLFAVASMAEEDKKPTLLVAGDSWTKFMCLESSFQLALDKNHLHAHVVCDDASKFGAKASQWESLAEGKKMFSYLKNDATIKAVYLSLGGNDFFDVWNKSLSPAGEATRFNLIAANVKKVADDILAARPDVKILISGYDFGNFKKYSKILRFYTELFDNLGMPTTDELQTAVVRLSNVISAVADQEHIFYIQHYGLAQYYYGNSDYHLKPKQTLPPEQISPPSNPNAIGGVVDEEVSTESLLNILGLQDAYHPNPDEFYRIAEHSYFHYLNGWLK